MTKRPLPPLEHNTIFEDLVDRLKQQPQNGLYVFQDSLDQEAQKHDGRQITKLSQAHEGPKS
ncbi:MAG: hypothetical protein WC647_00680 [Desulfomonilaceae bacterium]